MYIYARRIIVLNQNWQMKISYFLFIIFSKWHCENKKQWKKFRYYKWKNTSKKPYYHISSQMQKKWIIDPIEWILDLLRYFSIWYNCRYYTPLHLILLLRPFQLRWSLFRKISELCYVCMYRFSIINGLMLILSHLLSKNGSKSHLL